MTFTQGFFPPPVVLDGVRYQADSPPGTEHGCCIGAYDEATGERLWIARVHAPQSALREVVDIPCFFAAIEAVPGRRALALQVLHGPRCLLDLDTRAVTEIGPPEIESVDLPMPHVSTDIDFDEILEMAPPGFLPRPDDDEIDGTTGTSRGMR